MLQSYEGLFKEWQFIRSCSISFINNLRDEDLNKELPRKGLNNFRKHFQEMIDVEKDFIKAIETKKMSFNGVPDGDLDGNMTKEELLSAMQEVDDILKLALEALDADAAISWFGEAQSVAYHISALIAHEALHIGQIIAFCYVLDIDIPEYVIKNWALSGK